MKNVHKGSCDSVLLIEQSASGHRFNYLKLLIEAALHRQSEVVVVLPPSTIDSDQFRAHIAPLTPHIKLILEEVTSLKQLRILSKAWRPSVLVVPDGDRFARQLLFAGRWADTTTLSLLIMREEPQRSNSSHILHALKRISRRLALLYINRMKGVELHILKSSLWNGTSRFSTVIDPVTVMAAEHDVSVLRRDWELSDNVYWYAVLGAVSQRKNVPLIAQAIASQNNGNLGLLIAGTTAPEAAIEVQASVESLVGLGLPVIWQDRLLTDVELDAAILASDCVVLAHSNEGPSGLLGKAAATGTPVVAAGAVSLRQDLESRPSLGVWCPLESRAMAAAMSDIRRRTRPEEHRMSGVDQFASKLLGFQD